MNATVERIVNLLFEDLQESEEVIALREEVMNNCQERYRDLRAQGLGEDDAIGQVVESLKGMEEMLASYPKKKAGVADPFGDQSFAKAGVDTIHRLRAELKAQGTFLINLMSSPGAGKTTVLARTIGMLRDRLRIGVMEADIDSAVDADTIAQTGVRCIQLHTGGMCHLDADMTRQGIRSLGMEDLDLVFLENVGNLVCPADFDTGAAKNVMILSVPEGDDKPLKYPLMFSVCDVVLINKCDTLFVFDDFSAEKVRERILKLNPKAEIFFISAKTGEGFDAWIRWVTEQTGVFTKNHLRGKQQP